MMYCISRTCEVVAVSGGVGVAVCVGRGPVCGPPGVSDTHVRHAGLREVDLLDLLDLLLQHLHLPRALHQDGGSLRPGAVNTETSGVISSVLQPLETRQQNIKYLLSGFRSQMIQICKYPTHLLALFSGLD